MLFLIGCHVRYVKNCINNRQKNQTETDSRRTYQRHILVRQVRTSTSLALTILRSTTLRPGVVLIPRERKKGAGLIPGTVLIKYE